MSITRGVLPQSPAPEARDKCLTIVQEELELEMLVFVERGKLEYPKKNLWEQGREPTTNDAESGNRIRATLVGDECSHHCAIPTP